MLDLSPSDCFASLVDGELDLKALSSSLCCFASLALGEFNLIDLSSSSLMSLADGEFDLIDFSSFPLGDLKEGISVEPDRRNRYLHELDENELT